MEIESLKLVYFSPTGTTKTVVQGIAHGINPGTTELIDITRPDARKQPLMTSENELLVLGVPVYMGRVPALLNEWLNSIQAHNTPTVCVVVYGNREYDDALLELKNIVTKCGCIPIACAGYIGEHSFSNSEMPTAEGRPDEDDLLHAEEFGRKIREKLQSVSAISQISDVQVPGTYPYRRDTKLWIVDFIAVNDECTQCGTCAELCPTGAIDPENSNLIDTGKCITCCACIKNCPQNARSMKPGLVKDASVRLHTLYSQRKEPECFI
ncbi:EFR1 family ferrodoxin [Methanosarcina sp. WWM596]|uniref:EFR1 family ferrodoxin n=1 Tax=Methanosarcina sp. WWM596 TaxID=1434103 RepID=UPI000615D585|nr:EFR1 family ferrodoxin [Methanosarcina sp. WWM596]AKB20080.1 Ferredoxin [Methanosarcina sp. WWM596]